MMISDKHFRLSKTSKRMIGLMKGTKGDRNQFKKMMIQAELYAEAARKASLKSKDKEGNKGRSRGAVAED